MPLPARSSTSPELIVNEYCWLASSGACGSNVIVFPALDEIQLPAPGKGTSDHSVTTCTASENVIEKSAFTLTLVARLDGVVETSVGGVGSATSTVVKTQPSIIISLPAMSVT